MVLATFAVQGLTYVVQLALAPLLGPRDFGIVRVAEAIVGSAALIAAAGMPSMMMRLVAERPSAGWHHLVATRVLATAAASGVVVGVGVAIGSPWLATDEVTPFLRVLSFGVALTAVARTAISYFYGTGAARRVPVLTVPAAIVSATLIVLGARLFGLSGWAAGRVIGEALLVVVVVRAVLASARPGERGATDPRLGSGPLLRMGIPLAIALVARSLIDNAPVLVLARLEGSTETLGVIGLVSLVAAAITVVPAGVITLALPTMVRLAGSDRPALGRRLNRLALLSLALTLAPAILGAVLAVPVVERVLPEYGNDLGVAAWLLVTVPSRVVASLGGTAMLATDQVRSALHLTLGTLAATIALLVPFHSAWGLRGIVLATVLVEAASALAFVLVAHHHIARPAALRPPPPITPP